MSGEKSEKSGHYVGVRFAIKEDEKYLEFSPETMAEFVEIGQYLQEVVHTERMDIATLGNLHQLFIKQVCLLGSIHKSLCGEEPSRQLYEYLIKRLDEALNYSFHIDEQDYHRWQNSPIN